MAPINWAVDNMAKKNYTTLPEDWLELIGWEYGPFSNAFQPLDIREIHFTKTIPEVEVKEEIPGCRIMVGVDGGQLYFCPITAEKIDVDPICLCEFSQVHTLTGLGMLLDAHKIDDLPTYF